MRTEHEMRDERCKEPTYTVWMWRMHRRDRETEKETLCTNEKKMKTGKCGTVRLRHQTKSIHKAGQ